MHHKDLFKILLVVYTLMLVFAYSTTSVPVELRNLWQNSLFVIAPLVATGIGIYALRRFDFRSIHGKTLLLVAVGLAFWSIAELLWLIFESILGSSAFPSVADFFYLAAYPMFILAAVNELRLGSIEWTKIRLLVSLAVLALLSFVTLHFNSYLYNANQSFWVNMILLAYVVADLLVIAALVLLVNLSLSFKGGAFFSSWFIFAFAMLFYWLADLLFAVYQKQYGALQPLYRQIDYLWIIAYLLISYALFRQIDAVNKMKDMVLASVRKASR
ncbi:MAG: hypothetical protein V1837_02590 [Candidatus Woesearchaeota archaeon]